MSAGKISLYKPKLKSEKKVKTYKVESVVDYYVEGGVEPGSKGPGPLGLTNGVLFRVPKDFANACFGEENNDDWEFEARLSLVGKHQASNAATAIASAMALKLESGYSKVSKASIVKGLELAALHGRFEIVDDNEMGGKRMLTIVDGAHTKASAECVAATLRGLFPTSKLAVVMAMASDKDHEGFCSGIQKALPSVVVFTETPIAGGRVRSAGPGALAGAWQVAKMKTRSTDRTWRCRELIQANIQSALAKARHELSGEVCSAEEPGVILVTGSLHACDLAGGFDDPMSPE